MAASGLSDSHDLQFLPQRPLLGVSEKVVTTRNDHEEEKLARAPAHNVARLSASCKKPSAIGAESKA